MVPGKPAASRIAIMPIRRVSPCGTDAQANRTTPVSTTRKIKPPTASIATIRVAGILRLDEMIDRGDEVIASLLARHEIALTQLTDPYAVIPLKDYVALLEDLADLSKIPYLGAEMGRRFRPADIGPLGLLFSLSGTLRSAFGRMDRYLPAFQTLTSSGLMNAGEFMLWAYKINDPRIWPRRQDAEYAVMATCGLIRSCLSKSWRPVEVHFEHSAPADPAPLRRMFGAPVLYNQASNGLLLERQDIDRVNRHEDRDLLQVLERHIAELLKVESPGDSFAEQVERLIAIYLGKRPVTLNSVAAALDMPQRSLQRRLADEGTSLRQLLRDYRTQIAGARLQTRDGDTAALAETLGYSDRSAFSRAYRGWTGRAPVREARNN